MKISSTQKFWRRFGLQIVAITVYLAFLVPSLILASVESLSELPNWRSRIHGLQIVYNWSAEYTGDLADDLMFAFVPVAILVLMHLVGSYVVLSIVFLYLKLIEFFSCFENGGIYFEKTRRIFKY